MISITYVYVHMYKKGMAAGRLYSERVKATQRWVLLVALPPALRSPSGPHGG